MNGSSKWLSTDLLVSRNTERQNLACSEQRLSYTDIRRDGDTLRINKVDITEMKYLKFTRFRAVSLEKETARSRVNFDM